MSGRDAAARYARALLDVAISEGDPQLIGEGLSTFAAMVHANGELSGVLENPAVPAEGKQRIVAQLVERMNLQPPLRKLLELLAQHDRMELVPDLAEVYRERLMEHQQIVQAEVTTAMPLAPEHIELLKQRLAQATGQKIAMTTSVDPLLIGGMVARIGGTVYDGTVATQLAKMREKLLQET